MRFVLDHDVAVTVRKPFVEGGHECWSVGNAGLALATDEDIAVYAHDQAAALVSHDRQFATWRKERTVGQHLWLKCPEPDAAGVVKVWLDRIIDDLDHMPDVVLTVGPGTYSVDVGNWPKR